MAHVELSLSAEPGIGPHTGQEFEGALMRWVMPVASAQEACLLLDNDGLVAAASAACRVIFGTEPAQAAGYRLTDVVLLLDFTAGAARLPEWELDKIPPLLALSSGGLARGLIRVRAEDGSTCTLDAISTPLREGDGVIGSLTFFAAVGPAVGH